MAAPLFRRQILLIQPLLSSSPSSGSSLYLFVIVFISVGYRTHCSGCWALRRCTVVVGRHAVMTLDCRAAPIFFFRSWLGTLKQYNIDGSSKPELSLFSYWGAPSCIAYVFVQVRHYIATTYRNASANFFHTSPCVVVRTRSNRPMVYGIPGSREDVHLLQSHLSPTHHRPLPWRVLRLSLLWHLFCA